MTRLAQQPVLTPTLYSHPSNLTPKNISEQLTPYFSQITERHQTHPSQTISEQLTPLSPQITEQHPETFLKASDTITTKPPTLILL
jgi:hypothetical protein